MRRLKSAHNSRKALLVISDGGDNNSRYSKAEILRYAKEADVQVYGIGIHDSPGSREEMSGPLLLEDLAGATGGQHFMVRSTNELPDIAARIGVALHEQYMIGYQPPQGAEPGKWVSQAQRELRGPPPADPESTGGHSDAHEDEGQDLAAEPGALQEEPVVPGRANRELSYGDFLQGELLKTVVVGVVQHLPGVFAHWTSIPLPAHDPGRPRPPVASREGTHWDRIIQVHSGRRLIFSGYASIIRCRLLTNDSITFRQFTVSR